MTDYSIGRSSGMTLLAVVCACGCLPDAHAHYHGRTYCGHCTCNRYRPRRERWWQIWRKP
jgi:hypothetical protein